MTLRQAHRTNPGDQPADRTYVLDLPKKAVSPPTPQEQNPSARFNPIQVKISRTISPLSPTPPKPRAVTVETKVAMAVIPVKPASKDDPVNRREGDRVDEDMIHARAMDKAQDRNMAKEKKRTNADPVVSVGTVGSEVDEAKVIKRNLLDSGKHPTPQDTANETTPRVPVITSPRLTTRANHRKKEDSLQKSASCSHRSSAVPSKSPKKSLGVIREARRNKAANGGGGDIGGLEGIAAGVLATN